MKISKLFALFLVVSLFASCTSSTESDEGILGTWNFTSTMGIGTSTVETFGTSIVSDIELREKIITFQ